MKISTKIVFNVCVLLTGIAQAAETKTSEAEKTRFLVHYPHLAQLKTLDKPDEFPLQRLYETNKSIYLLNLFAIIRKEHYAIMEEFELYINELEQLMVELETRAIDNGLKTTIQKIRNTIEEKRAQRYPLSPTIIMKKYPHLAQIKNRDGANLLHLFIDNPKQPGPLLTLSARINTQYSRDAQEYLLYLQEMYQFLNGEAYGRVPQTLIKQLLKETSNAITYTTQFRLKYPHLSKLTFVTPEDETIKLLHAFATASTDVYQIQAVRFMIQKINQLGNAAEFEAYAEELKRLTTEYYLGIAIDQEVSAFIANKEKQLYGSSSSSATSSTQ